MFQLMEKKLSILCSYFCLPWPEYINLLYVMLLLNCKGGLLIFLSLLIVTPIVGFCNCSMFFYALLCIHSSFAIISGCFALFVILVSHCRVAFPHHAIDCLQLVIVVFPDHTHYFG